jgi:hypothetical protein
MAKIVQPPIPKQVACASCGAIIEYLPEEVEYHSDADHMTWSTVKCPRDKCPGHGYPGRNRT